MVPLATLRTQAGSEIAVTFERGSPETLAREGEVDAYIVATEDGFSPLGSSLRFLSADLGVAVEELKGLADWNRFNNSRVTLVALPSRRDRSFLRGVILAASETSECYKRFSTPLYGRPYRDFYYNVTYEAIAQAVEDWGARRLAISHLSGCGRFHADIATCNAEALAHYFDEHPDALASFAFVGCCISDEHLAAISRLNREGVTGGHRRVSVQTEDRGSHKLLHIEWEGDA